MTTPPPDDYVDLREYIAILRIRKWSFLLVTLIVVAIALGLSARMTPLYKAQAKVLVKSPARVSTQPYALTNLETEREIASSDPVSQLVAENVDGETLSGGTLAVTVQTDTEILIFAYTHPSPVIAQQLAQAYADSYLEYRRTETLDDLLAVSDSVQQRIQELTGQLEQTNEDIAKTNDDTEKAALQSQANALIGQIAVLNQELSDLTPPDNLRVGQVVGSAALPAKPTSPNHLRNGLLGLIFGSVLGIAMAFLKERLDDGIRGRDDLEAAGAAPVLAAIPPIPGWRKRGAPQLVSINDSKSSGAESYRTLRTNVLFAAGKHKAKVIMVSSANPGEGKTTTTANLGVVLAQAGRRVVIISADLRRPRIAKFFGIDATVGLSNALAGEISPWQGIKPTEIENLQILPAGEIPGNPAELLGSEQMGTLLTAVAESCDIVLVDSAPILAVSDALAMVALTDGVLFVADGENTTRQAVAHARRQLDQVHANIIGMVLNNFDVSRAAYRYYGYGYGYGYNSYNYRYEQKPPRSDGDEEKSGLLRRARDASSGSRSSRILGGLY